MSKPSSLDNKHTSNDISLDLTHPPALTEMKKQTDVIYFTKENSGITVKLNKHVAQECIAYVMMADRIYCCERNKDDKIYNTLTNSLGHFEFYLPFGTYTITMDEGILNERFRVTSNNLPIKLRNKQDGVYVSFYIIEKRRKVIFKDFTKKKND